MDANFQPTPHAEAIALIKGKAVVPRRVFDQLLPELRARAFTVTGIEGANALQRIRDTIAALPAGQNYEDVKKSLVDELDPYLGDGADQRAELLLRTHGFQAFQAANWRTAQEDEDTTHLQYLATEDDRVRDSHLALNGLILPKNDPFWDTHTPPWEWGCRCRVRAMNPDLVDAARQADEKLNPDQRLVVAGAALDQLRMGTLVRDGQTFNVLPPAQKASEGTPYQWHPSNLKLPLADLAKRYDANTFNTFAEFAKRQMLNQGYSLWDYLNA
jgi:SPP1 gp7 family putative phage head morphogenesis protein